MHFIYFDIKVVYFVLPLNKHSIVTRVAQPRSAPSADAMFCCSRVSQELQECLRCVINPEAVGFSCFNCSSAVSGRRGADPRAHAPSPQRAAAALGLAGPAGELLEGPAVDPASGSSGQPRRADQPPAADGLAGRQLLVLPQHPEAQRRALLGPLQVQKPGRRLDPTILSHGPAT